MKKLSLRVYAIISGIALIIAGGIFFWLDSTLVAPVPATTLGTVQIGFVTHVRDPRLELFVDIVRQTVFIEFRFLYERNGTYPFFAIIPYQVRSVADFGINTTWRFVNVLGAGAIIYGYFEDRLPANTVRTGQMRLEADVEGLTSAHNRGLYTFILPLGAVVALSTDAALNKLNLKIGLVGPGGYDAGISVGLPLSAQITQTFPSIEGLNLVNRTKSQWVSWSMSRVQTVSVSWLDPDELAHSQDWRFFSSLFLGVGIPTLFGSIFAETFAPNKHKQRIKAEVR